MALLLYRSITCIRSGTSHLQVSLILGQTLPLVLTFTLGRTPLSLLLNITTLSQILTRPHLPLTPTASQTLPSLHLLLALTLGQTLANPYLLIVAS